MAGINDYQKLKAELGYAEGWLSLIGTPYSGGGGGIGAVHEMIASATVYSQAYNGAKNYHEIPDGLKKMLSEIVREKQKELFAEALIRLKAKCDALAKQAVDEHAVLLQEAGLTTN